MDIEARANFNVMVAKDKRSLAINMYNSYISPHYAFSGSVFTNDDGWSVKAVTGDKLHIDMKERVIRLPVAKTFAFTEVQIPVERQADEADDSTTMAFSDDVYSILSEWSENEWELAAPFYSRSIGFDQDMGYEIYAYETCRVKDATCTVVLELPYELSVLSNLGQGMLGDQTQVRSITGIQCRFAATASVRLVEYLSQIDNSTIVYVDSMVGIMGLTKEKALEVARHLTRLLNDISDEAYDNFDIWNVSYPVGEDAQTL